jgi:hypothetical protein
VTRVSPSAATVPGSSAAPAGGEAPLVDHASLVLRAGRMGTVLPHMGWIVRFPTRVTQAELTAEARRLASSPYALGRRVAPRRVPGARRRWVATTDAPPARLAAEPVDGPGLSAWLDAQLTIPLDPEHGHGWLLTATPTVDGGTVLLVLVHHLFGTAPGVLHAAYGDGSLPAWHGTTEATFTPGDRYGLRWELDGVGERLQLGLTGAARAAADGARAALRRTEPAKAVDPPPIPPPKGRDATRRAPGPRRAGVVASFDAAVWDAAAAARGGTGNTLLAAIAANLVRRGRAGRGGDTERPVRLVLPIDLGDDAVGERRDGSSGPRATMVTASLVLPGGPPEHGDLSVARRWTKAAFVADAASAPPVRGVGDATRLLPEALTIRAAERAAMGFDACASNPGALPDGVRDLGPHRATDACVVGWPIGLDLLVALSRTPETVSVSAVGDPSRLGPEADVRAWFGDELHAWGLPDGRW